ncbi:Brix domain-containing protein [Methanobrevibacter filiformis]|uniref:Probable Brix domain-containing ribosomal biogenesis protein n=1 Tax=Methanobrevibacter filiformis TaxID=55758 RepID=A0A166CAG0_9EURY|nr:hypothetical protein [Methanobrevibacter filiformis]KZX12677.1 ribosomal biogenesis protein [Methanobrevibacter filiformis]
MLISSSRKPSQKTRSFCKNLSNALDFPYINRGKMSIRDLFLKAHSVDENSLILVYENKGNPSKITFYNENGDEGLSLIISAKITKERLNIDTNYLKLQCDFPKLEVLSEIMNIPTGKNIVGNYIHIKSSNKNDNIAIIEFYNNKDSKIDFEIAIKKIIT